MALFDYRGRQVDSDYSGNNPREGLRQSMLGGVKSIFTRKKEDPKPEVSAKQNDIKGIISKLSSVFKTESLESELGKIQSYLQQIERTHNTSAKIGEDQQKKELNKLGFLEKLYKASQSRHSIRVSVNEFSTVSQRNIASAISRLMKDMGVDGKVGISKGGGGGGRWGGGGYGDYESAFSGDNSEINRLVSLEAERMKQEAAIQTMFAALNAGMAATMSIFSYRVVKSFADIKNEFFEMIKGAVDFRVEMKEILHGITLVGERTNELVNSYSTIEELVSRTGEYEAVLQKLVAKEAKKGLAINLKELSLEKARTKEMKGFQDSIATSLSTSTQLGMNAEETASFFAKMRRETGFTTAQTGQLGRDLKSIAQSIGVYGDSLQNAMSGAAPLIKALRDSANLTSDSTKAMIAGMAAAEKYGVSDAMFPLLKATTSLTEWLGASDETRRSLTRIFGISGEEMKKLVLGGQMKSIEGFKIMEKGLKNQVNVIMQAQLGQTVLTKDGRKMDVSIENAAELMKLFPEKMQIASHYLKNATGVQIGEAVNMWKSVQEAGLSTAERIEKIQKEKKALNNRGIYSKDEQFEKQIQEVKTQDFFTNMNKTLENMKINNYEGALKDGGFGDQAGLRKSIGEGLDPFLARVQKELPKAFEEVGFTQSQLKDMLLSGNETEMRVAQEALGALNEKLGVQDQAAMDPVKNIELMMKKLMSWLQGYFEPWLGSWLGTFGAWGASIFGEIVKQVLYFHALKNILTGKSVFSGLGGILGGAKGFIGKISSGIGSMLTWSFSKAGSVGKGLLSIFSYVGSMFSSNGLIGKTISNTFTKAGGLAGGLASKAGGLAGGLASKVMPILGKVLPALGKAGGFLFKGLPLIGPILGAIDGAMNAKGEGKSTIEGATFGALTGNAGTGSNLGQATGITEKGTVSDQLLGVVESAVHGAMTGWAFGGPAGALIGAGVGMTAKTINNATETVRTAQDISATRAATQASMEATRGNIDTNFVNRKEQINKITDDKSKLEELKYQLESERNKLSGSKKMEVDAQKDIEENSGWFSGWFGEKKEAETRLKDANLTSQQYDKHVKELETQVQQLEKSLLEKEKAKNQAQPENTGLFDPGSGKEAIAKANEGLTKEGEESKDSLTSPKTWQDVLTEYLPKIESRLMELASVFGDKSSEYAKEINNQNLGIFDKDNVKNAINVNNETSSFKTMEGDIADKQILENQFYNAHGLALKEFEEIKKYLSPQNLGIFDKDNVKNAMNSGSFDTMEDPSRLKLAQETLEAFKKANINPESLGIFDKDNVKNAMNPNEMDYKISENLTDFNNIKTIEEKLKSIGEQKTKEEKNITSKNQGIFEQDLAKSGLSVDLSNFEKLIKIADENVKNVRDSFYIGNKDKDKTVAFTKLIEGTNASSREILDSVIGEVNGVDARGQVNTKSLPGVDLEESILRERETVTNVKGSAATANLETLQEYFLTTQKELLIDIRDSMSVVENALTTKSIPVGNTPFMNKGNNAPLPFRNNSPDFADYTYSQSVNNSYKNPSVGVT